MMAHDGIDDNIRFMVTFGHFCTKIDMRAFHFVVNSLANVMEQTSPFG